MTDERLKKLKPKELRTYLLEAMEVIELILEEVPAGADLHTITQIRIIERNACLRVMGNIKRNLR